MNVNHYDWFQIMRYAGQLRAARALLGWNQDMLAESSGVGIATVRRLEGQTGRIRAKGLINSREQLDSLLTAKDLGVQSIQEYLQKA